MAISQLILACEVMYTMVAVEPCLVVVAQGCMQKICKGGGGGANLWIKKKRGRSCASSVTGSTERQCLKKKLGNFKGGRD